MVAALGGTCDTAIAAFARCCDGDRLRLEGAVLAPDGSRVVRDRVDGSTGEAGRTGEELARRLIALGAKALMAEVAR
jgi:hydroxymethylbilane synthase